jgi:hypothetical protein
MVEVPGVRPVITPLLVTMTVLGAEDVQVTPRLVADAGAIVGVKVRLAPAATEAVDLSSVTPVTGMFTA